MKATILNNDVNAWAGFEDVFKGAERFELPIRWDGSDIYDDAHKRLEEYRAAIGKTKYIDDTVKKRIYAVCEEVLEIVREYLHGYPSTAYELTKSLLNDTLINESIYADPASVGGLYRMSRVDKNIKYGRERIFHIPYNMRPIIPTYRYSIAGYPSLYLASSLALAERETGLFASNTKAIAAKFKFYSQIKIIDFGYRPQAFFDEGKTKREDFQKSISPKAEINVGKLPAALRYMLWYPLIMICSYIRTDRMSHFAPEYIVPQLLTQWLRSKNEGKLVGIRYFSCISKKASAEGVNYVFSTSGDPLIHKDGVKQYCPLLNSAFTLTEPVYLPEYDSLDKARAELDSRECKNAFISTAESFKDETSVEIKKEWGVMYIPARAFENCRNLETIILPEGIKRGGANAFKDCSSLKEITLPESLTRIVAGVFWACSSLTEITLPKSLSIIGNHAFRGCSSLPEITLPESLISIGDWAFCGCSSLIKINGLETLKNLTSIGDNAFSGCSNLPEITLPESLTCIGSGAFMGCTSLQEIPLPESLTSIDSFAFHGCSSVTEITLPESLTSIGDWAFASCTNLKRIIYKGTEEQWNSVRKGQKWDIYTPSDKIIRFLQN